jgi:hypothetical protein
VLDLRTLPVRFHVRHQPHDVRHRSGDRDLRRAHEGYRVEAGLAGRKGRELGGEVGRHREHHADDVVGRQLITAHHLGDKLRRPLKDRLTLVGIDLDRSPNCPDCHVLSLLVPSGG